MNNIQKALLVLQEMSPYYNPNGLTLIDSPTSISLEHLKSAWVQVVKIDNFFYIYKKRNNLSFILGIKTKDRFKIISSVVTTLPRSGTPIFKNAYQVEMVYSNDQWRNHGYTKLLYKVICDEIILLSDSEQYGYSKKLWQSLAKDSDVNIYVYDCLDKSLTSYDYKNINETEIWGRDLKHISKILVGTTKQLL